MIAAPLAAAPVLPAPFIVGVPRSGTTLLRLQLDAHPDLAIPSETGFGPMLGQLDPGASRSEVLAGIVALPTWADLTISRDELAACLDRVDPWSPSEGVREYYRWYAQRHGKLRWGDKTPLHIDHLDLLADAFPEARFTHVIRDGRDVAASVRGLPFAPGEGSIEAIAIDWRDRIARARRAGEVLPHYREVRYERLVAEPETELRDLCSFLELPFDAGMLRAHERAGERLDEMAGIRAAGGVAHDGRDARRAYERLLSPPDAARVGTWRDALTGAEAARFERVAGATLDELGYGRSRRHEARRGPQPSPETAGGLQILIGANAFDHPGGTESYVFTVARELQRLGHAPLIAAAELGAMAEHAERSGLPVADAGAELPVGCDAVLAQDRIAGAQLADRYPSARLVHVAHSDLYDHQLPLLVEGVVDAVVVLSDRIAARIRALPLDVPIVRLRHPIDTELFAPGGDIAERPRRALLLSNYLTGARRRALVDAWEAAGVECVQVGARAAMSVDVVPGIRDADIVVGKARAALEAMSCARAVYVFDMFGGDGWVTEANYAAFEADNFAGFATGGLRKASDLERDLLDYRADMGWTNRELVRTHHAARRHALALLDVLRGPKPPEPRPVGALSEVARLTRTNWDAERRTMELQTEMEALRERAVRQEADRERANEMRRLLSTRGARYGVALSRLLHRLRRGR